MTSFLKDVRPEDLQVENLGATSFPNKFTAFIGQHTPDDWRIAIHTRLHEMEPFIKAGKEIPSFEVAGSREKIFFDPEKTTCGVVTCGGLCPGLNDVIRSITLTLRVHYGVKKILGFRYGYWGITDKAPEPPLELTEKSVEDIHQFGGTILGSSRGPQDSGEIIDTLVKNKVNILFTIGGDGTLRGCRDLYYEIKKRNLSIAVVGIPKTIDNDIQCTQTSFGFNTAVSAAEASLEAAHAEAKGAFNGIGLVKVMGRDSGFIAAHAALANNHVNFCLIPEIPFKLEGKGSFLEALENRFKRKNHAVILVAEGAGQHLFENEATEKDASGNLKKSDIGPFLKMKIKEYLKKKNIPVSVKYIDPSYTIRSLPANSFDSTFCLLLGQHAVHAGMAGKTNLVIGYWNQHFTNIPIEIATKGRKKIDPNGRRWKSVLATLG